MVHSEFLIKLNRSVTTSTCAICGKTSERNIGPELFTVAGEPVCLGCGQNAEPELAALLMLGRKAEDYIATLLESSDRFTSE